MVVKYVKKVKYVHRCSLRLSVIEKIPSVLTIKTKKSCDECSETKQFCFFVHFSGLLETLLGGQECFSYTLKYNYKYTYKFD